MLGSLLSYQLVTQALSGAAMSGRIEKSREVAGTKQKTAFMHEKPLSAIGDGTHTVQCVDGAVVCTFNSDTGRKPHVFFRASSTSFIEESGPSNPA